ncbi:hypothetical protein GJ744_011321 [Endocarpon pusillum]|uniref:Uncharacterized protein n=1 Tax=Endocarpon pusillum TaxID=364733 RepID=A0A8H7E943_9EURO|nr:hypothetical protein GJ744_011321 [Endocarpon pusillum]
MELPLLQSVYAEVLRLYVDVIVARNLEVDVTVPIGYGGDDAPRVRLSKGDIVSAPAWTVHRDSGVWPGSPPDHFDAQRFSVADEKGQKAFSMGNIPGWVGAVRRRKTDVSGESFCEARDHGDCGHGTAHVLILRWKGT